MKVRTHERANERTNERTNEKAISLMYLCEKKQRNMWKKSKENLQRRWFPVYFRHFRLEKMLSKIDLSHILDIAITRLCAKNQAKQIMKSRENAKKPVFPAFSAGKMFFEYRALSHFKHCHFASVCKISWKNINYSSINLRNTVFPAIFKKFRLQKSV